MKLFSVIKNNDIVNVNITIYSYIISSISFIIQQFIKQLLHVGGDVMNMRLESEYISILTEKFTSELLSSLYLKDVILKNGRF